MLIDNGDLNILFVLCLVYLVEYTLNPNSMIANLQQNFDSHILFNPSLRFILWKTLN